MPPSGAAMPSGAVPSTRGLGGGMLPAAEVNALRSIRPESSALASDADDVELLAGEAPIGPEAVRALKENRTDDSFRAPVATVAAAAAAVGCGALVMTSSSLPALSIPPSRSVADPRPDPVRAATRTGAGAGAADAFRASASSGTDPIGCQSAMPSVHTYVSAVRSPRRYAWTISSAVMER